MRTLKPVLIAIVALLGCASCATEATMPASSERIQAESFAPDSISRWVTEADEKGYAQITDGHLEIAIQIPDTLQYASLNEAVPDDFIVDVDTVFLAGSLESSYGIMFRMKSPDEFYRFDITGDGRYVIEKHTSEGSWVRLSNDWTPSDAIQTGIGAQNRLRVVAIGGEFQFYVNEVPIEHIEDLSFASGTIALDGGTFSQPGLRVAFDNFTISER